MKKPIIGIVAKYEDINFYGWSNDYINNLIRYAIIKNGGIAIGLLPQSNVISFNEDDEGKDLAIITQEDKKALKEEIKLCDGIVLQGGLASAKYEEIIAKIAIENDIPLLGICAGQNNMIRALNGDTILDTNPDKHDRPDLKFAHKMKIDKNSKFYQIVGQEEVEINSIHNYVANKVEKFNVVAYSDDGHKEVIELPENKFCLGVKFHPELLVDEIEWCNNIFKKLIEASKK